MNNMIQMNVSSCLTMLERVMEPFIEMNDFTLLDPFFLWGQPGIGKSTLIQQLKNHIEKKYHKHVKVIDLRLYEYTEVDLKGVPYASQDHTHTIWLAPQLLNLKEDPDTIYLLFLDELLASRPSVQAVALQMALDRKIDQLQLPKNMMILAASNREEDGCYLNGMSMALANRFSHIEILPDVENWLSYAYENKIDPRIIGYIEFHPTALFEPIKQGKYVYCTPRRWEKLSHVLKRLSDDQHCKSIVCSMIGEAQGIPFVHYLKQWQQLPTLAQITSGKGVVPKQHDGMYMALTQVIYALKHQKFKNYELEYLFDYIYRFPDDYIMHFLLQINQYLADNLKILSLPAYQYLAKKVGHLMR